MFKDLLASKNITQKKLADKVGVTQQAVSLWINGKRAPSFMLIEKIADALNVSRRTVADSFMNNSHKD